MLTKRIIPCLDVHEGRVVKGVSFVNLRDAGDPAELAAYYDAEGADELVFLDITASSDAREIMVNVVEQVSEQVFIPLTVGGGIRKVADVRRMLEAGADKVSLNTAAVQDPTLVSEAADFFGCQCIVVAIDARSLDGDTILEAETVKPGGYAAAIGQRDGQDGLEGLDKKSRWQVVTHGGRTPTDLDAVKWARRVAELGAGELLVTSMDTDGQQERVRPGAAAGHLRGRVDSRNRQRWRRKPPTHVRRAGGRESRRRPGRQHLPLQDPYGERGQGVSVQPRRPHPPGPAKVGLGLSRQKAELKASLMRPIQKKPEMERQVPCGLYRKYS